MKTVLLGFRPLHWLWLVGTIILVYLVLPFFQPEADLYWGNWGSPKKNPARIVFSKGEKKQFLTVFAEPDIQASKDNPSVQRIGSEKKIILLGRTRNPKPSKKESDFSIRASPKLN